MLHFINKALQERKPPNARTIERYFKGSRIPGKCDFKGWITVEKYVGAPLLRIRILDNNFKHNDLLLNKFTFYSKEFNTPPSDAYNCSFYLSATSEYKIYYKGKILFHFKIKRPGRVLVIDFDAKKIHLINYLADDPMENSDIVALGSQEYFDWKQRMVNERTLLEKTFEIN